MGQKEKIEEALKNGATTRREIFESTHIGYAVIDQHLTKMRRDGRNLYEYKGHNTGPGLSKSVADIMKVRQSFIDKCGFPPRFSWVIRKTGYTKQYISQVLAGINDKDTTTVKHCIKQVFVHKDFHNMLLDMMKEYDVNYREALKIFTYKWAKDIKNTF